MNPGTQCTLIYLLKSNPPYHIPSTLLPCLPSALCSPSFLSPLFPFSILRVFGLPWVLTEQLRSSGEPSEQKGPQPFHLGEWMSRARGLVRAARCWAHVLRGEGCEGGSESGGEVCEVRKGLQGQESSCWTTRLTFTP